MTITRYEYTHNPPDLARMLAGLLLGRNQAMIPCQHGGIEVYSINLYILVDDFI
jgi:hypothetical protein